MEVGKRQAFLYWKAKERGGGGGEEYHLLEDFQDPFARHSFNSL